MKGNKANKKYEKITISFTDADDDIIEYVAELKKSNKASEFIREAIREKINRISNESEIENTVEKLENRMNNLEKIIAESKNINDKKELELLGQVEEIQPKSQKENQTNTIKTPFKEIKDDEAPENEEVNELNNNDMRLGDDLLKAIDFFDF